MNAVALLGLIPAGAAFLAAGVIGAVWGGIPLHLHRSTDYAAEVLFVIGVLATIAAAAGLRRYAAGRVGSIGAIVTQTGLAAMAVGGIATIATSDDHALGPVFVLGLAGSVLGMVLFALALFRDGELGRWVGPVLAVAWVAWPLGTALLILPGLALLGVGAAIASYGAGGARPA